ncbi:MAG: DUF1361 domain-containing protein [Ktedonobacteraceae bacterium]
MSVLLDNMPMIGWNSFLTLIPILCGWLMFRTRQKLLQGAFALLWFSFLPNTLYILTDLRYLPEQWNALHTLGKIGLALQYLLYELIGVSSFLLAVYPLEKLLLRSRWRENKWLLPLLLITANFFIGFGMVLGRVQRINSWDIFLDTSKVIQASVQIVSSLELLLLMVLFGCVANAVYFLFRIYRGVSVSPASRLR